MLQWRLRRTWRAGKCEQKQVILGQIQAAVLGAVPERVEQQGGVTDVVFRDGVALRLGPCHRPAVRALRASLRDGGDVYLAQASDHGRCWGLYFAGPQGRLALLALELRLVRDRGRGSDGTEGSSAPTPRGRVLLPV